MEQVFQAMVDRNRASLGIGCIKTILRYKRRPTFNKDRAARRWKVVVEKPTYDLTVFKVLGGRLTLKVCNKGERVLRLEALVHRHRGAGLWSRFEPLPMHRGASAENLGTVREILA